MRRILIIIFSWLVGSLSFTQAQETDLWTEEEWVKITESSLTEENYSPLSEEWQQITEEKININRTDQRELEQIPFLSALQVENLLYYLYRYGPMVSLEELKLVEDLDAFTIERLTPLLIIGDPPAKEKIKLSFSQQWQKGRHEAVLQTVGPLFLSKGFLLQTDSLAVNREKGFQGDPLSMNIRYRCKIRDFWQFGFSADKDRGEPWINNKSVGFDFWSFHCYFQNIGLFKAIALGDYKVSFGQGLAINNGFLTPIGSDPSRLGKRGTGISPSRSIDEVRFLRGAAFTMEKRFFQWSVFYSYKRVDGNRVNDTFPSITTGHHQTITQLDRKGTIGQQLIGGNLTFERKGLTLELTSAGYFFDAYLLPQERLDNVFAFRGKEGGSISFSHSWKKGRFRLFGEAALSFNCSAAILQGVEYAIAAKFQCLLLYRYYDPSYPSFFSKSYAATSGVNNEEGFLLSINVLPFKGVQVNFYADVFHTPWLTYLTDRPYGGAEAGTEWRVSINRQNEISFRYKYQFKEYNFRENLPVSPPFEQRQMHRMRLSGGFAISDFPVNFRTVVECNWHQKEHGSDTWGWMLSQGFTYRSERSPWSASFSFSIFDTQGYDNRIYLYQKNLLYNYGMGSFYGKGFSAVGYAGYHFPFGLDVSIRLLWVYYADRSQIGSDLEMISGSNKGDIGLQLRYLFTSSSKRK